MAQLKNGCDKLLDTLPENPEDIRIGGIEGGGTHSILIVVDGTGKRLSQVRGPDTNHWAHGMEETAFRINDMIVRSKQELFIPETTPYDCVGLTLSGSGDEETDQQLVDTLLLLYPNASKNYTIGSDTIGSLRTGFPSGGIVMIAGTGSNALLMNPDGKSHGCGGWGHMLGDEGGAYWMAHKACKYVFDDLDGLEKAPHPISYVWPAMRNYFHVKNQEGMLTHLYAEFNKSKFAMFTKELVLGCEKGDPFCLFLFQENGKMVAQHIVSVSRHAHNDLKLEHGGLKVICVGSVWKSWEYMKKGFVQEIHRSGEIDELSLLRLTTSAAIGACYVAADKINCTTLCRTYEENTVMFFHYKRDNLPKDISNFDFPRVTEKLDYSIEVDDDILC